MVKKNTKKVKYDYIVNVSDIECLEDIDCVFALAKHNAGLALTDDELEAIVIRACEKCAPKFIIMHCDCKCENKKLPWYKRFWNKLKYAFTW
jgi:hypothetical protein